MDAREGPPDAPALKPGVRRRISATLRLAWCSIGIGRDHLSAGDRPECPPGLPVDRVLDKADAAVGKQGVDAAGMIATGRHRRVRWAAIVLILRGEVGVRRGR